MNDFVDTLFLFANIQKGEKNMRKFNESENGILLTYKQACERYNLGMNTVQRLARQGDALVKIGKSARVDVEKMDSFVLSFRE